MLAGDKVLRYRLSSSIAEPAIEANYLRVPWLRAVGWIERT